MTDLRGKRYWIVGASEGLGASLAHRMSAAGVDLILSARSEEPLQRLANDLPGKATVAPVDMTDMEALRAVLDEVGEIDGVVQVAGVYWPFGGKDWNAEQAATMADVNFGGVMRLVGAVLPGFVSRDRGHIVLTGSLTGYRGLPASAPYTASKSGVMALAESLYADLRKTGVKVQLINPGFIRTRLTDKNDFKMPFIMEPDAAAKIVFDHMCSSRFQRPFPRGFAALFRLAQFLPDWAYYRLIS